MVILASKSPRRRALLKLVVPEFKVIPSDFDERSVTERVPDQLVRILARAKAGTVAGKYPGAVVIGSDTVVVSPEGEIFGIPENEEVAAAMLRALSGHTHRVMTGVCVLRQENTRSGEGTAVRAAPGHCVAERCVTEHCVTEVTFRRLSEEDIAWYLSTGEPFDKAGAYGIQGKGALLVEGICGDYHNVVGLPILTVQKLLQNF